MTQSPAQTQITLKTDKWDKIKSFDKILEKDQEDTTAKTPRRANRLVKK